MTAEEIAAKISDDAVRALRGLQASCYRWIGCAPGDKTSSARINIVRRRTYAEMERLLALGALDTYEDTLLDEPHISYRLTVLGMHVLALRDRTFRVDGDRLYHYNFTTKRWDLAKTDWS